MESPSTAQNREDEGGQSFIDNSAIQADSFYTANEDNSELIKEEEEEGDREEIGEQTTAEVEISNMMEDQTDEKSNEIISSVVPAKQNEQVMQHVICHEKKEENGSGQKDEDGEIGSDREESKEKEKTRKRPREREPTKTLEQQYSEEPRTKKAALEQLKSMRFATKDPFKDNPPRDRPTLPTRHRERTPPRKVSTEETRRRRDEPINSRRRRSRSRGGAPVRQRMPENASSTIESRHQRSTLFFLQNEQRAAMAHHRAAMPKKSLHERIETLLARPDHEVITFPADDLKTLIMQGAELFKEQEHFIANRRAHLYELDSMIATQREGIERISQELPPQYRPPLIEEMLSSRREQPQPQQQHQTQQPSHEMAQQSQQPFHQKQPPPNFSVPPPIPNIGNSNEHQIGVPQPQPIGNPPPSFVRPPPTSFPLPPPPANSIAHFGQTSSLLFSKPPPTSTTSTISTNPSTLDTTIPPPSFLTHPAQPQSSMQIASSMPSSNFSVPPPQIARPHQQEQQMIGSGHSPIPQLMRQPPPNIFANTATPKPLAGFQADVITSSSASFTSIQPNFSLPPPILHTHTDFISKQQQMLNVPNEMANFIQPAPQTQQPQPLSGGSPSVSTTTTLATSSSASPKPPPRPLMSINLGFPPTKQSSPQQKRQEQQSMHQSQMSAIRKGPAGSQYSQSSSNESSAEMTRAASSGRGGRGGGATSRGRQHQSPRMAAKNGIRGGSGNALTRRHKGMPNFAERTQRRQRFSSSPTAPIAPSESREAEAKETPPEASGQGEEDVDVPTSSAMSSPGVASGEQQADSSTQMPMENDLEEIVTNDQQQQPEQHSTSDQEATETDDADAEPAYEIPVQSDDGGSAKASIVVQAADTTISSTDEMLPVSP